MTDSVPNSPAMANTYKVGTLTYTKRGLAKVIFWLILGYVFWGIMQIPLSERLPLKLKEALVSDFGISLIVTIIPAVIGFLVAPFICFKSDRHRGKRGRRIPFILLPIPFVLLFLILTAHAPVMGSWIASHLKMQEASKTAVIIGLTAVCMACFEFLNGFASSVFLCLVADVVPGEFLTRFMALSRLAGMLSVLLFYQFFSRMAEKHMTAMAFGVGLLSAVALITLCLRVKEGEYGPPPEQPYGGGLTGIARTYYHECLRNSYYVWLFVALALAGLAGCCQYYAVFFYHDGLGLPLNQIGEIEGYSSTLSIVMLIPAAYLCDRLHPLRVFVFSLPAVAAIALAGFFCVQGSISLLICALLASVPAAATIGIFPIFAALLPKERFGQFYAAAGMVSTIVLLLGRFGGAGAGSFMGWVGNYRYVYLWSAIMYGGSFIAMLFVYRAWLRHGGMKNYVPPA